MNRKPPIHCTPCRVTFNGTRYRILADGSVAVLPSPLPPPLELGLQSVKDMLKWEIDNLTWHSPHSDISRLVRREAARLRRNRNNRERHAAMKDLGLTKTKYGWE